MHTNESGEFLWQRQWERKTALNFLVQLCVCVFDLKPLGNEPFEWFAAVHFLSFYHLCYFRISDSTTYILYDSIYLALLIETQLHPKRNLSVFIFSPLHSFRGKQTNKTKWQQRRRRRRLSNWVYFSTSVRFPINRLNAIVQNLEIVEFHVFGRSISGIDNIRIQNINRISCRMYFVMLKSMSILDKKFIDYKHTHTLSFTWFVRFQMEDL